MHIRNSHITYIYMYMYINVIEMCSMYMYLRSYRLCRCDASDRLFLLLAHSSCSAKMLRAADEGMSTPMLAQHISFHMGPRFCSHARKYAHVDNFITAPHLMTHCHICLADVVCVPKVCPLVPVHECQTMKSLDRVCCHAATKRDIVLRTCSHVLQKFMELLSL